MIIHPCYFPFVLSFKIMDGLHKNQLNMFIEPEHIYSKQINAAKLSKDKQSCQIQLHSYSFKHLMREQNYIWLPKANNVKPSFWRGKNQFPQKYVLLVFNMSHRITQFHFGKTNSELKYRILNKNFQTPRINILYTKKKRR